MEIFNYFSSTFHGKLGRLLEVNDFGYRVRKFLVG